MFGNGCAALMARHTRAEGKVDLEGMLVDMTVGYEQQNGIRDGKKRP